MSNLTNICIDHPKITPNDIIRLCKNYTKVTRWCGRSAQWTQYAVDAVGSGIVVYGCGDIVFGAKGQTSGCNGCSVEVCPWCGVGLLR